MQVNQSQNKLYVVTRQDFGVQYEIPQVAHSIAEFAAKNREAFEQWSIHGSNSLVVVAALNEAELYKFREKLKKNEVQFYEFVEPDIGYGITAIAIEPCDKAKKLCSSFRLAGQPSSKSKQLDLGLIHDYVAKMQSCLQTKGLTVLDHGMAVEKTLFDVLTPILNGEETGTEIPLPKWFIENKRKILSSLPSEYTLRKYTRFHDIGKPWCMVTDENGKVHFPNHSEESYKRYLEIFPDETEVAELIRHDLDIHTLKSCELEQFMKLNKNHLTHLVVGLAEILANALMFGGFQSDSFKIKFKHLERRGNAMFRIND